MKPEQTRTTKTEYTAWAVQVLRDGEWEWCEHVSLTTYTDVKSAEYLVALHCRCNKSGDEAARVRKVRVTVEEV